MKKIDKSASQHASAPHRRNVLVVDGDDEYAHMLRRAWLQLRLGDDLKIVSGHGEALSFLRDSVAGNGTGPVAAIVVDPESTGEETGAFLRAARKCFSGEAMPIVFWTRDRQKYEVLEGRGVISVLRKPMVLRMIQALDEACRLRMRPFSPYIADIQGVRRSTICTTE